MAVAPATMPLVSWGDAGGSWAGFLDHVLRREYGTFQLTTDGAPNTAEPKRVAGVLWFFVTRTLDAATWHVAFVLVIVGVVWPAPPPPQLPLPSPQQQQKKQQQQQQLQRAPAVRSRQHESVGFGWVLVAATTGYFFFFALRANIDTSTPLLAGQWLHE